jgi:hypothetical protein
MPIKQLSDGNSDGTVLGQSTTDLIGFYGVTAVDQPAASGQAALTITAITVLTTTPTNTAIATRVNQVLGDLTELGTKYNAIRGALISLGLIKGSA